MFTTTVCAALSAAGLAVAFLTAWRRRFAAATRIAAVALVPVGLAMSGLVGLGGKIGRAFGGWAADLVLKPTVWAGFAVLACAVVLWIVGRAAARRSAGRPRGSAAERKRGAPPAAEPSATAPALGPSRTGRPRGGPEKSPASGTGEDFSDIEAILKKHGI
ncbi:hypothetical protein FM076_05145 [Streptomyces albus subsp. chlorinus]|uniref:hypothetical protein n=1 Tax=Streptomyces albus TaxID=1888 RepID=UPI0015710862|nr:hypothetical protein [Streptomyces albus]NSC20628.1 hypothetical protein [Streptomyces albus subsp. chlorinus]